MWDVEASPARKGEPFNTKWLGAGIFTGAASGPYIEADEDRFFETLLGDDLAGHWIYAHNASGYDFHFLIRFLVRRGIPWRAFRTGQRIFLSACDREFYDSQAILHGSLANIGETLGVSTRKQVVEPDFYEKIKAHWKTGRAQAYLRDDLISLFECIETTREACRTIGVNLRATVASTAMAHFRLNHLDCAFPVPAPWSTIEQHARQAYVGGRVEVFKREAGAGCSWDLNSSYPAAMVDPRGVPCEYLGSARAGIPDAGIVFAQVDVDQEPHPPLPVVGEDERLYFPTGRRRSWITADEARFCVERYGAKSVQVIESHAFKPRRLFDSYIAELYPMKGKPGAIGYTAKLLMNSLYGKFGSRREREAIVCGDEWHDWPHDSPKDLARFAARGEAPGKRDIDPENWIYGLPTVDNFSAFVLPALAATITARGRIALQGGLDAAGDAACYCDTDSVYAELAPGTFPESAELGGWKRELEFESAIFAAPKTYAVTLPGGDVKAKAKGLRRTDAAQVLAFMRGESIPIKRVLGVFEANQRNKAFGPASEIQHRQAKTWSHRRHPDGRAFSIAELDALGLYVKNAIP